MSALSQLRVVVACTFAVACLVPAPTEAEVSQSDSIPLKDFPRERIVIETRSARRHELDAWRADTPQTRAQGLMFVRDMDDGQAMIFIYQPPVQVSMWMKNTLLPLDMLFVDGYGCVVNIQREARPGSLAIIPSDGPVEVVVELKGGAAATLGVDVGDRVLRPDAGWPVDPGSCARKP